MQSEGGAVPCLSQTGKFAIAQVGESFVETHLILQCFGRMLDLSWTLCWGHLHDRLDPSVFAQHLKFAIEKYCFLRWFGVNFSLSFTVRLVLWSKGWQASRFPFAFSRLQLSMFFWESFLCLENLFLPGFSASWLLLCYFVLASSGRVEVGFIATWAVSVLQAKEWQRIAT